MQLQIRGFNKILNRRARGSCPWARQLTWMLVLFMEKASQMVNLPSAWALTKSLLVMEKTIHVWHLGTLSRSNWNLEVLVFEEREKPEYPERKTSKSREENQQQFQPTYDKSGNQTWATLCGSECSHHCAIPCPPH